jgi:hypothetical protein
MQNRIEMHKERNFSSILGDAVTFVKQNFIPMGKSLVLIVVPAFVVASVMFGMFFVQVFTQINQIKMGNPTEASSSILGLFFSPMLWLTFLFYYITILLAIAVIFIYIKIYSKRTDDTIITVGEVWQATKAVLLRFFFFSIGYGFLFFLLYLFFAFVLGLIFVGLIQASTVIGSIFAVLTVIFIILSVATYVSILLPVILYEEVGFFETLGRTSALLKGSFWQTVATIFVAYILVLVFGIAFNILFQYLLQLSTIGSASIQSSTLNTFVIAYFAIVPVIMLVAYAFQLSVSSFAYYSLLEKRDHVGLKMKVDSMGDAAASHPEEQY